MLPPIQVASRAQLPRRPYSVHISLHILETTETSNYLSFLSTKTTTSEKVNKSLGYRCITAYCLPRFSLLSAQIRILFELCANLRNLFEYQDVAGPSGPFIVPRGGVSPPSKPSQSANSIGDFSKNVVGLEYRCTSPEVGRLSPMAPTTGEGNLDWGTRPLCGVLLLPKSTSIFTSVLFPAPTAAIISQDQPMQIKCCWWE